MIALASITSRKIVAAAQEARTLEDAQAVNRMITASVGGEFRRPLGDVWNTLGLVSQPGDFDHKVVEAVTNAQDAILEREAAKRFGSEPVPFDSPRGAAEGLLDLDRRATYDRIHVEIRDPGESRRITFSVRDDGCGMTPAQMTKTILRLGSEHKTGALYLQGAFGLGVKSTFRNARAAVIISRRAPEMGDDGDRVTIAVIEWAEYGMKGLGASYLTTTDWKDGARPDAEPWSATASEVDFPVGTQVLLVDYAVKGLHRARSGDDRAFQAVANTRLHEPIIPFRQTSLLVAKPEPRTVYGLARSLAEKAQDKRSRVRHGYERMPFALDGRTYQLPVGWWAFPAAATKPGGRASTVASGHVVSFTSSGQVHHHWDKTRFKAMTSFNKIDDRIYAIVETDALPIRIRTRLFTPDRASLVPNEDAQRLEDAVAAFLRDIEDLKELNGELQREAVESALGSRKTRAVAQRISLAIHARGFTTGAGNGNGQTTHTDTGKRKKLKLLKEPTELTGPKTVTMRPGETRTITFWLDAKDAFVERGVGSVEVTCDHPAIGGDELAVGGLRDGRVRVTVLVHDEPIQLGEFALTASVPEWSSAAGGLAGPLTWETTLVVTDEPRPPRNGTQDGGASGTGAEVALQWRPDEPGNVAGWVEDIEARNLAKDDEYKDLAKLGEQQIPTVILNDRFTELKRYCDQMRKRKGEAAVEQAKGRYATAVGVGLLVLRADEHVGELDDEQVKAIARAHARTALSLLPDFDTLLAQLEDD